MEYVLRKTKNNMKDEHKFHYKMNVNGKHHENMHHNHDGSGNKMYQDQQDHASHMDHSKMIDDFRKRFIISLVLTIPILLLTPMIQHFLGLSESLRFAGDTIILFVLSTIIFVYGGYPFLKGFYFESILNKKPGMMTLIALAISVAYLYSAFVSFGLIGDVFFWELATLIDIMLIGHWIEMKSVMSASKALNELIKLLPSVAHKVIDSEIIDVPLRELKKDDTILIKPGEKIPADGYIIDGITNIDESILTGESKPVSKKEGDLVIGGSLNGEGAIKANISRIGKESYLNQVLALVEEAQKSKSRTQNIADKAALFLTIAAIISGGLTFFIWEFIGSNNLAFSIERAVTVMIIACPHALGLAIPLVVSVTSGIASKNGFLIRNRAAFETARNVNAVVFDKTGTLTSGKFGVTNVISFNNNYNKNKILTYAASLELNSQHPIAKGIIEASKETLPIKEFNSITGIGVKGKINNDNVMVVSPGYLINNHIEIDNQVLELQSQGKTVVFLIVNSVLIGAIALGDEIRKESKVAIELLNKLGIKTIMLTGDNSLTAKYVSSELNLSEYIAEVLPDEKSNKIKEIQDQGYVVAMVGDGINDAPALAISDVGIAIGAGSDVAVETADLVLAKNNPIDVTNILKLSRSSYKKMVQNLWWALGYNIVAIPLAAGIFYNNGLLLSPALGAVFMSLSTVIVAINARLLKI